MMTTTNSHPSSQDSFVDSYLTNQRSHVFTHVAVLIFVFDVASKDMQSDMVSFASTIRALHEFSPNSKIFVLIHKMDLIDQEQHMSVLSQRRKDTLATCEKEEFVREQVDFAGTSIWNQTLYKAWTKIMYFLTPNISGMERILRKLAELIDAKELVLYERTTCLVVISITRGDEEKNPFMDRFERLSSILKTHKHSMAKHTGAMASEVAFAEMQIKSGSFMFFITRLTENTNLAVVMANDEGAFNAARVNIQLAKPEFAYLDIVEKKGKEASRGVRDEAVAAEDTRGSEDGEMSSQGQTTDRR